MLDFLKFNNRKELKTMKLNLEDTIEYSDSDDCESQCALVINDFLSNRIDNDSIIFYPVDRKKPGHPDIRCGIEKNVNGKLNVDSIKFECKSAKYHYVKDGSVLYDGSLMFSKHQIHSDDKKLTVIVLKTDKQIDRIIIGYLDTKVLLEKNILRKKKEEYRYRFNRNKVSYIAHGAFQDDRNGHKHNMVIIASYNANEIKDIVKFWNSCNIKERSEYVQMLSITDLILHDKPDFYNELTYKELQRKVK